MKKYKLNTKEFEKYNKLNEIDNDMICLIEYLKYHERSMDDILFYFIKKSNEKIDFVKHKILFQIIELLSDKVIEVIEYEEKK